MAGWKRQPQERPGDYFFSGRGLITAGVNHALAPVEVAWIAATLRRDVLKNNGLDYLQVFKSGDGRTVWAIDQLSQSMKEGDGYTPEQIKEYDCWTLLLPEEY